MSIRALKAAGYVQTKKKVHADHDYLAFPENSAVYSLQVDCSHEKPSTTVLAETMFAAPTSSTQSKVLYKNISLSGLLSDKAEDVEYSLKVIESVPAH